MYVSMHVKTRVYARVVLEVAVLFTLIHDLLKTKGAPNTWFLNQEPRIAASV